MSRTPPALATVGRAYAAGRVDALRPPSPLQAHRTAQALAQASPEVVAAYQLGRAADPAGPMPEPGAVLGLVVAQLAGAPQVPGGAAAGPVQPAPGELGQLRGTGGQRPCPNEKTAQSSPPTT